MKLMHGSNRLGSWVHGLGSKLAVMLAVSMLALPAMASGSSPGAAIAAGLADGDSEMGLVFAAVAVLLGLLLVWSYIKRSAK